jgi:hypothetical protein
MHEGELYDRSVCEFAVQVLFADCLELLLDVAAQRPLQIDFSGAPWKIYRHSQLPLFLFGGWVQPYPRLSIRSEPVFLRLETHDRRQKGKQPSDLVRLLDTIHDLDRIMLHVPCQIELF